MIPRFLKPLIVAILLLAGPLFPPIVFAQSEKAWLRGMERINPDVSLSFSINPEKIKSAGLRVIESRHLIMYTDVLSHPKVDQLPQFFDQCMEQWCDFFEIGSRQTKSWKMRAYLISDRAALPKFRDAGVIPEGLLDFQAGYQQGHDIWFFLQPGKYYTRHLLIHEGTHAFMQWFLKGYGAPWFSEGVAEMMGANRLVDGKLDIRYRIQNREEAEYWARVKRIRDERNTSDEMTLDDVLRIEPTAFRRVRNYGWSWAAVDFLSRHRLSKKAFRKMLGATTLSNAKFNQQLKSHVGRDWFKLQRDWQLFIDEIEYGYEVERGQIVDLQPNGGTKRRFDLKSNHSWQSTQIRVQKGDRIRIRGTGRFLVGQSDGTDLPCEANGITIRYHRGYPLGMLMAGILDVNESSPKRQISGLTQPVPIGPEREIVANSSGLICLRINESPSHLEDNMGTLRVEIESLQPGR